MARPLKIEYPGALYHITSRGNAKQAVFLDDEDRSLFLRLLKRAVKEYEWRCYSYCLMNNHYHLLVETPKANLSRGMHFLNSVYAQKHNERHEKVGHLLQGRYHAVIIDKDEYLLEVCRYIVLNPVRAGIVEDPAHYRWSSYLEILNKGEAASFLDTSYVLCLFSQPGSCDADEYRAFVLAGLGIDIWSNLRGSSILGGEAFAKKIQERIAGFECSKEIRKKERFAGRPELLAVFGDTDLSTSDRNQKIIEAHTRYGYIQREIARHLHLNPSWVCKIIASIAKATATFKV